MIAVILNGPIGSGKDTIVDALVEKLDGAGIKLQFKDALYEESFKWLNEQLPVFMSVFIPTYETWVGLCTHREHKEAKVIPTGRSFHLASNSRDTGHKMWSPRMVLQHVSENVVKPYKGADAFGEMSAERLVEGKVNLFSDGGFVDEINVISQVCPTIVVNLYREGYSFDGDSRDYVKESMADATMSLHNDVELSYAVDTIDSWIFKVLSLTNIERGDEESAN